MSHYNVQFRQYAIVVVCEAPDAVAAVLQVAREEFKSAEFIKLNGTKAVVEVLCHDHFFRKVEATVFECGDPR